VKTSAVLAALSAAILTFVVAAIDFAGGYSGFPLLLPFAFLPAAGLPLIIGFLAGCWAIVTGCILLWRRHIRSTALVAVLLCLSWVSLRHITRPAFLTGLAARLRTCSSPAEIEQAARSCLSLMPQGGYAYGPDRMIPESADEKAKEIEKVLSKYCFAHLAHGCAIVVRPPFVDFEWGSAITGHWGIRVGKAPDAFTPAYSIHLSDNIILFQDVS
jgi:hypothetical protein